MSPNNLFPIKFWRFMAISFGWGCYNWKLLKMTQNYYQSPLKVNELKVWDKQPPDVFQNVKTVQQQGSLISILTGSSKICLLVRVLCIWFNLCWRFLVPCSPCVISSAVQLYYVLVATIPHISSETNPPPPL